MLQKYKKNRIIKLRGGLEIKILIFILHAWKNQLFHLILHAEISNIKQSK